ncbi:UNVERIFIED_CONTAM: hypothetical protein NCL1_30859 [Trichonephila clavipes]
MTCSYVSEINHGKLSSLREKLCGNSGKYELGYQLYDTDLFVNLEKHIAPRNHRKLTWIDLSRNFHETIQNK